MPENRCERAGQYDLALKLLNEMRKKRIRFYDIGILDELFKRLLAAVSLLRSRGGATDNRSYTRERGEWRGRGGNDGASGGRGGGKT